LIHKPAFRKNTFAKVFKIEHTSGNRVPRVLVEGTDNASPGVFMDDTMELPYPEWQRPLQEAILEFDRDKLAEKTRKAVGLSLERLLELQQSKSGHHERAAIIHGLSMLRTIKCDRFGPA
jgi:hypothetical protein